MENENLVRARHLKKYYRRPGGPKFLKAVDDVSFTVAKGETLGLVGESGCGKSTLGRLALRLIESDGGRVFHGDTDVTALSAGELRRFRRNMQIVFQDPYSSLDPRMTVGESLAEPLVIYRYSSRKRRERIEQIVSSTGLSPDCLKRYPHQFSGGQRQRIVIARALMLNPSFIVADEPVSSLDVSVQAQILNLLRCLQEEFSLSYLFVSHDVSVVRYMSRRIAVMYRGTIVEEGPSEALCSDPLHPYTQLLIGSVPQLDGEEFPSSRDGEGGNAAGAESAEGCLFAPRCGRCGEICLKCRPAPAEPVSGRRVACHLYVSS